MLNRPSIFLKLNAYKKGFYLSALLLYFIMLSFISQAQRPSNFGQGNNTANPAQEEQNDGPDSTVYEYFITDNIFEKYTLKDSLADTKFLHRNTLQNSGHESIHTGNFSQEWSYLIE